MCITCTQCLIQIVIFCHIHTEYMSYVHSTCLKQLSTSVAHNVILSCRLCLLKMKFNSKVRHEAELIGF